MKDLIKQTKDNVYTNINSILSDIRDIYPSSVCIPVAVWDTAYVIYKDESLSMKIADVKYKSYGSRMHFPTYYIDNLNNPE